MSLTNIVNLTHWNLWVDGNQKWCNASSNLALANDWLKLPPVLTKESSYNLPTQKFLLLFVPCLLGFAMLKENEGLVHTDPPSPFSLVSCHETNHSNHFKLFQPLLKCTSYSSLPYNYPLKLGRGSSCSQIISS